MDYVQVLVSTLAAGAIAGLKPVAEKVVKDAYAALKTLIAGKYQEELTDLESNPGSTEARAALAERLRDKGVAQDDELLSRLQTLLDVLAQRDPAALTAAAIDVQRVKAAFLKIDDVSSSGAAIKVRDAEFTGGIEFKKVQAGTRENPR